MNFYCKPLFLATVSLTAITLGATRTSAATCESLASLSLPNTAITGAQSVPAGTFATPTGQVFTNMPAFCRVTGTATPTSDSDINFEVWLPATAWNGKFNGDGNGGYGGSLATPYQEMAVGLQREYAVAGTDMGHSASVESWALNHPEKIADWGYRANHVTAVNAKAIIRAFYGKGPRLSYWTGCSDGGHEALMEAERFPDDYDGIIAGASANYWTHQSAAWVWEEERSALDDPTSVVPPSKLTMISHASVAQCAGQDGGLKTDAFINDPRDCHFDPAVLQCTGPDAPTCLTAAQVQAVREIYAGPRNPRTGEQIYPGLEPGGEYNWPGDRGSLGRDFYKFMVFNDPNWNFHTLDFDHDIALGDAKQAAVINSTNPDLRAFRERGGKLIMYHGWFDARVNPRNSINYYEAVVRNIAGNHGRKLGDLDHGNAKHETDESLRLFMVPGMTHCLGGPGPNNFGQPIVTPGPQTDAEHNVLSALEGWVEHGVAPEKIVATKFVNDDPMQGTSFTRPLCPYPQLAVYKGVGDTTTAANFVCVDDRDDILGKK